MRTAAIDTGPHYYSYCAYLNQNRIDVEACIVTNLREVYHGSGDFWINYVLVSKNLSFLLSTVLQKR